VPPTRVLLSLAFAAALLGCPEAQPQPANKTASKSASKVEPKAKSEKTKPLRKLSGSWEPLKDYVLLPEHEAALKVAQRAILAKPKGEVVDYQYRVSFKTDRYSVLVWRVVGYRPDGSPLNRPGGSYVVQLKPSGELERILGRR